MKSVMMLLPLLGVFTSVLAIPVNITDDAALIAERQYSFPDYICCQGSCAIENVGDGDPHQDYLHQQVSQPLDCGDGDCSAAHSEAFTFGWSVTGGVNSPWFNGGFSVSESWTSGNSYSCSAINHEKVCVWIKVAHTAYTVHVKNADDMNGVCSTQPTGSYIMESPNNNNHGGEYYCQRGAGCKDINDNYWCYNKEDC